MESFPVTLADGNALRIHVAKHFRSIVRQSVIHYPIRGSWRPRQVQESRLSRGHIDPK
jgi:hypothetical protein